MKKIIVLGAGGHAKVLIEAIISTGNFQIEGLLDVLPKWQKSILGFPLLGSDDYLYGKAGKDFSLALGVGCTKATSKRKEIFERFAGSFDFPPIIHSSAEISKWVELGKGVQVMSGVIIHPTVTLAENVLINTGAIIEHDCAIGAHTHVSVRVVLGGNVTIGSCSHLGIGATILQGITIGNYVTIGAGAVVTEDIADGKTVAGIPAKEL